MKTIRLIFAFSAVLAITACAAKKKTTASATAKPVEASPAPNSDNYLFNSTAANTTVPGDAQLNAIHAKYADVTMDKLKKGYSIYTQGACIDCHSPKNIYDFSELEWNDILSDMALRANLTVEEKDAVSKYILSMKATQTKAGN